MRIRSITYALLFASLAAKAEAPSSLTGNLDELKRTTSCVYGNLPLDVQFNVQSGPPRIGSHASFGDAEAALLARALDQRLALVLGDAFDQAMHEQPKAEDKLAFSKLSKAFEAALQANAAKKLNLEFCGSSEEVGQTVVAALAGWFGRSMASDTNSFLLDEWFGKLGSGAKQHEAEFAMLATAKSLSTARVDMKALIDSFQRSLSEHGAE